MSDTPGRLLTLLSLLQSPREWPGSELAERLGVSARTIRRDIDRLRELGYPVRATRGAAGGYQLVAGAAMPPLLLDDDEAVAIAVGLRTASGAPVSGIEEASVRALAKLEQVLPSRLRRRVAALGTATVPMPADENGPSVDPRNLTTLAAAVAGRERVRFGYQSREGERTRRLVEPYRLVAAGHRWYLLAHDVDRDDWRIFRADRIEDSRLTGARFAPREPPERDAAAFLTRKLSSMAPTYEVVATLRLPAEEAARLLGTGAGEVRPIDAHSCRLRGHADTVERSAAWLLMLGCDFEVHEPPELVAHLRTVAARAAGAAGVTA
ncbi:helix-turn-helix transcriptional regulator [Marinitenerispora sediminis]|uniref:Transcriptional regulator n=1 Tax=Marinitenerispora sediminis TaxID=1931232 RepID=A0A368TA21_9ACTN|nr:YafY family protein [Marinitenerispora sediminis]RCV52911.1 transcriptional regulator [Marinitenerispora sediminis]RCV60728.1 transcriptional regulator [Marinitenerispora sediminis]RCV61590.1 transcriptional regulator [Marinitenerispora sediminis]